MNRFLTLVIIALVVAATVGPPVLVALVTARSNETLQKIGY